MQTINALSNSGCIKETIPEYTLHTFYILSSLKVATLIRLNDINGKPLATTFGSTNHTDEVIVTSNKDLNKATRYPLY